MDEETIIRLMKEQASKLVGKISAYDNYKDKSEFAMEANIILITLQELMEELGKNRKR